VNSTVRAVCTSQTPDDFDLTLVARPNVSPSPSLHFGIRAADPDSVQGLLRQLAAKNVKTGDLFESDSPVAFHCWDPDGYQLEVFAEKS
jgi:hypothetical protein